MHLHARRLPPLLAAAAVWLSAGAVTVTFAGPSVASFALCGCGGWATNSQVTSLQASFAGSPIGKAQGTNCLAWAGFIETFVWSPHDDTDGDGIPDENDPDIDGDGLSNREELTGRAFAPPVVTDPRRRDTDGDGADDGHERWAGTDPTDRASVFRLTGMSLPDGTNAVLHWTGRAGLRYAVISADALDAAERTEGTSAWFLATGGEPPWYATGMTFTNAPPSAKGFFRVLMRKE